MPQVAMTFTYRELNAIKDVFAELKEDGEWKQIEEDVLEKVTTILRIMNKAKAKKKVAGQNVISRVDSRVICSNKMTEVFRG